MLNTDLDKVNIRDSCVREVCIHNDINASWLWNDEADGDSEVIGF